MERRVIIEPATRLEGRAAISVTLDEAGQVAEAELHALDFRGFEDFCRGRLFTEMPALTARICGICPASHTLVSAAAGDALLGYSPATAVMQRRRLLHLAQLVQSHALSFFHLSAPDWLLPALVPPAERNLFGLLRLEPAFAHAGIRLRAFGQDLIARLAGRRIHPVAAIAGGFEGQLAAADRAAVRAALPGAFAAVELAWERWERRHPLPAVDAGPSLFIGLVSALGDWELQAGRLRVVDSAGGVVADRIDPLEYREFLVEEPPVASRMKAAYFRPLGPTAGRYRVGPVARLAVCRRMGTPRADARLARFKVAHRFGRIEVQHEARLIEMVAALEQIEALLDDPALGGPVASPPRRLMATRGVGVAEAPRGLLFHDYTIDADGVLQAVNLLIATSQNAAALKAALTTLARTFSPAQLREEHTLWALECVVRGFDPCLSCATHLAADAAADPRLVVNPAPAPQPEGRGHR
jgi:NAD-reducing hydrogenase large subunit